MTIILYGHQACGKTYFGKLIAEMLGRPFIDTDQLIELKHQATCRAIANEQGVPFFRQVEADTIQNLHVEPPAVIAVGGGAILNPSSLLKLKTLGTLIYLEQDKATLLQRTFAKGSPAYLTPQNFDQVYEERRAIYESSSPFKVIVSGKSDAEVLNELQKILSKKEISQ